MASALGTDGPPRGQALGHSRDHGTTGDMMMAKREYTGSVPEFAEDLAKKIHRLAGENCFDFEVDAPSKEEEDESSFFVEYGGRTFYIRILEVED